MDEEQRLTKKERRLLRREERSRGNLGAKNGSARKIIIRASIIIILLVGGYFVVKGISGSMKISDIGETFGIEGRDHVDDGQHVDYKTNPPTSGAHYAEPSDWGVLDHEIPDEAAVHNLEHGGIWIAYRPGLVPAALAKLTSIVKNAGSKILMAPRSKNDKDIAIVSWGRYYKFDLNSDGSFDENAVRTYIKQYINTGPELVPDSMPGKNY